MNNSEPAALIQHLSKEIEQATTHAYNFRIRAAFTVWLGPYAMLGAVIVATDGNFSIDVTGQVKLALFVIGAVYLGLGIGLGMVEAQIWRQCEKWRKLIAEIAESSVTKDEKTERSAMENDTVLYKKMDYPAIANKILGTYVAVFASLLLSFAAIAYVATHLSAGS